MASRSDGETDRRLRKTSVAWSYFTLIDEEKCIASCNTCESHMSFRSSISNLMKHIKRKHGDLEPRISEDEKDSDSEVDEVNKVNLDDNEKPLSSPVWSHFEITSVEKKIATCTICQVPLSYKNGDETLLKHLRKKHNIGDAAEVISDDDDKKLRDTQRQESPPPSYRSVIWPYFRIVDGASKTARCLVCRKLLSYNTGTSNLRKHLARKHPGIRLPAPGEERKTILLSSGDQLYEYELETTKEDPKDDNHDNGDNDSQDNAQNEPIALDEVFLDEFNGSINRIPKYKNKKRKHKQKILEQSDSEDEVIIKKKYVKKPQDSIDLFARYVASLLKELPKQTSNRLQKEFIQQIMSAQAEMQRNAYSITIAEAVDSVPNDVRYEVITSKPENK